MSTMLPNDYLEGLGKKLFEEESEEENRTLLKEIKGICTKLCEKSNLQISYDSEFQDIFLVEPKETQASKPSVFVVSGEHPLQERVGILGAAKFISEYYKEFNVYWAPVALAIDFIKGKYTPPIHEILCGHPEDIIDSLSSYVSDGLDRLNISEASYTSLSEIKDKYINAVTTIVDEFILQEAAPYRFFSSAIKRSHPNLYIGCHAYEKGHQGFMIGLSENPSPEEEQIVNTVVSTIKQSELRRDDTALSDLKEIYKINYAFLIEADAKTHLSILESTYNALKSIASAYLSPRHI